MENKIYKIVMLPFLLLLGCGSPELSPDAYLSYCNDPSESLIQERSFGQLRYQLMYEPVSYKALKELQDSHAVIDVARLDSLKKEYEGLEYFVLKIENLSSGKSPLKSIIKNYEDLAKVNQYCQTNLEKDVYAESGGVKVPCALFHLEEDHNLVNFNMLSFAFESARLDPEKDLTVVFDDPMFNSGTIKFYFPKHSFNQLPRLKL